MTFVDKGKKDGVKGFTYEISDSSTANFFSASVKENANVWFRRYNNEAAFDAAEQEYGSAASFAGLDTPTISPSSASFDSQQGEMFSVSLTPDGFEVRNFPAPSSDSINNTWDGQYIWISDRANGKIYQIDESGNRISNFNAVSDPRGITWDGEYLWVSASTPTPKTYKYTTDGTELKSFNSPGVEGGMTWDGSYLYHGTTNSSKTNIYRFKTDGTVTDIINAPATAPTGLGFDGKYLWVATRSSTFDLDVIYQLDFQGNDISSFNFPGDDSRGMAWNGESLYITDRNADVVYEIGNANNIDISYKIGGVN